MARKYFYYVGVQNNNGMSFVTSVDNRNRMCHWDTDKKPLAMSSTTANDLAEGLMMNFFTAVVVKSFFELDKHFVSEEETVKQKVTDAVKQLGYTGEVHIATASVGRVIVWVDEERIGIYDLDRKTFVD